MTRAVLTSPTLSGQGREGQGTLREGDGVLQVDYCFLDQASFMIPQLPGYASTGGSWCRHGGATD